MLVEDHKEQDKRVWGYGMRWDSDEGPTWTRLDGWEGWVQEQPEALRATASAAMRELTTKVQRGRFT